MVRDEETITFLVPKNEKWRDEISFSVKNGVAQPPVVFAFYLAYIALCIKTSEKKNTASTFLNNQNSWVQLCRTEQVAASSLTCI